MALDDDGTYRAASSDATDIAVSPLRHFAKMYGDVAARTVLTRANRTAAPASPSIEQLRLAAETYVGETADLLMAQHATTSSCELRFEPLPIPSSPDTHP